MRLLQISTSIFIVIIIKIAGINTCGRRLVNHKPLITNGFQSNEGDWPWHAAIHHIAVSHDISYKCGGSLLNSNAILTASHCVFEFGRPIVPERVLIHLGKYNLILSGSNTQDFQAHKIITHPNYNAADYSNDIAIIRLTNEAVFNNYVQPICLWDSSNADLSLVIGKYGTVIGWGITETDQLSYILRQAVMPVVSSLTCLESNRNVFGNLLSSKNFCAGFRNGTSVCNGDSGGSLSFEENGVHYIRGIVSVAATDKAYSGCISKEYVIFTDVAQYIPWIKETIPELQRSPQISAATHQAESGNYNIPNYNSQYQQYQPQYTPTTTTHAPIYSQQPVNQYQPPFTPTTTQVQPQQLPTSSQSNIFDSETCGLFDISPQGHEQIYSGIFPWQVVIYLDSEVSCLGNLVSNKAVVTAASCFYKSGRLYSANEVVLTLGISSWVRYKYTVAYLEKLIIHDDYIHDSTSHDANVAIAIMKDRVRYSDYIQPICLWEGSSDLSETEGTVTGWLFNDIGTDRPGPKNIPIVSTETCLSDAFNQGFVSERTFCAGGDGSGPCWMKGSAMTIFSNGRWMLRGFVASPPIDIQNECRLEEYFVFTDIAIFADWIRIAGQG